MSNPRFLGEFRAQIEYRTDDERDAMKWLHDKCSIAARVVDTETKREATMRADGAIDWQPMTANVATGRIEHGRERSQIWTRNDPDLIPQDLSVPPVDPELRDPDVFRAGRVRGLTEAAKIADALLANLPDAPDVGGRLRTIATNLGARKHDTH